MEPKRPGPRALHLKTQHEFEHTQASGRIAAEIAEKIAAVAKPGVSLRDLDARAAKLLEERRAESVFPEGIAAICAADFPGSIGLSVNDVACYGAASQTRLQDGDVLKLDVWLRYDGFCARVRYTTFIGRPAREHLELAHAAAGATLQAIERLRGGEPVAKAVGALRHGLTAIRATLAVPDVGHGLGRFPYEEPVFPYSPNAKVILRPGMVIFFGPCVNAGSQFLAVNPDRYSFRTSDGSPTCAYGHTIGITDGEPVIFTML